jgi:hypothetical protein
LNEEIAEYRALAMKEYSRIVDDGKTHNAIDFWFHQAQHLQTLNKLALKNLITPATSVPSEQAFSVASYIGRKQRSRLSPENLPMSVFLKDKIKDDDDNGGDI